MLRFAELSFSAGLRIITLSSPVSHESSHAINLGTPEYIAHAKAIIERLKKMGITFPAVQENKLEDNGPALSDDKSISQGKTDENKTEWNWM